MLCLNRSNLLQTTSSGLATSTISARVTDPPLELFITDKAFRPNPTTVRFARTVPIKPGDVAFDIGTGIAPLAIKCALDGARQVIGVDPVPMHCELARMNVAKYDLQDIVTILEGDFFEPIDNDPNLRDLKADVIIGDVSGIADPIARALGWYSDEVPTGGEDGTVVIIDFLKTATRYLAPAGAIYFPIAVDLSDSTKILDAAREIYAELDLAIDRPAYNFPLSEGEIKAINDVYHGKLPSWLNIQTERRPSWRGQIWRVSSPR
jgi:hypothetical protein